MTQTMTRSMLHTLAVATTVAALTLGAIAPHATSVPLNNGAKIEGYIRSSSPGYRYRTTGTRGTSMTARGEDHTFSAQQGETITITVQAEDGSTLQPILVLFDPTGRQVALNNQPGNFRYQVPQTGTYRLLVLGQNNTLGRYTLAFNGMQAPSTTVPSQPMGQADQVMTDILKLRMIGCGVPRVAKIQIGTEERCTRDIEPGVYSYNTNTKSIQLVDSRRDMLASKLQLNLLENCPSPATSVVQIVTTDPQDNRDYTYCAQPTRYVKAGSYRYDPAADRLVAADTTTTTPTIPVDPKAATRKQMLLQEYGLNVLDNCPAARNRYVVVNFPEGGQLYQYCANPNRLIAAGEYTFDEQTGGLNKAGATTGTANDCAVSVGGICLLKK